MADDGNTTDFDNEEITAEKNADSSVVADATRPEERDAVAIMEASDDYSLEEPTRPGPLGYTDIVGQSSPSIPIAEPPEGVLPYPDGSFTVGKVGMSGEAVERVVSGVFDAGEEAAWDELGGGGEATKPPDQQEDLDAFLDMMDGDPATDVPPAPAADDGIVRFLADVPLFRELSEPSRALLRSRLVVRSVEKGSIIIREGEPGNALFVLTKGVVDVTKLGKRNLPVKLATLGAGSFFGEFALLSDRRRHATVTMVHDGTVLEISSSVIAELTKSDPAFGGMLQRFFHRRLLETVTRSAPFFGRLSEPDRNRLVERLHYLRIAEHTKLITEGQAGGSFYLVLAGEVHVSCRQPDGSDRLLARLSDGDYIGEMSLLRGGVASATVTAATPTEVVQLAPEEFHHVLKQFPDVLAEVEQEVERRELANLKLLAGRAPDSQITGSDVLL